MSAILLGQKTVDMSAVFVADAVFDSVAFSAATSYTKVEGPFSLAVQITNNLTGPVLFGIIIETETGVITIADRTQIGFIAAGATATISSASVPHLAEIRGTVVKITIRVYRFSSLISSTPTVSVALQLDNAYASGATLEPIGADRAVFQPGMHTSYTIGGLTLAAGAADVVVLTTAGILAPFRFRLTTITLGLFPTPFPSDTLLRVFITRYYAVTGFTSEITRVRSKTDEFAQLVLPGDWVINSGDAVSVAGSNVNAANAYEYYATLSGEVIY
jgi:hypothetical protein